MLHQVASIGLREPNPLCVVLMSLMLRNDTYCWLLLQFAIQVEDEQAILISPYQLEMMTLWNNSKKEQRRVIGIDKFITKHHYL